MQITEKAWVEYITKMSQISQKAADLMQSWVQKNGLENDKALLDYTYALSQHYGQAIGALSCQMYEATAAAQGVIVPTAEVADLPDYGEVAKAVKGTQKKSPNNIPGTIARLVKQVGADTTLKNAERDGAQFAWVPHGDTCAFCITLASRGWQYMSKKAMRNGHAEHIHAHCDCEYAVRFDGKSTVAGYDPDKYLEEYNNAGGDINAMRRIRYKENKEAINARKRELYAKRKAKTIEKTPRSAIMESDLGMFKQKLRSDGNMDKEYYDCLKDKFSHGTDDAKRLFTKYASGDSIENAVYENTAHYNTKTKKISMNYGADLKNPRGAGATWFHEHGHLVDDLAGNLSDDKNFIQLLESDSLSYRIAYGKAHHLGTFDKVDKAISEELGDMRKDSAISDLFDGVTQGNIIGCASHPKEYWKNRDNVTSEAFAHMFEAQFDKKRYEQMKNYFPNALEYFEKKMKEAL